MVKVLLLLTTFLFVQSHAQTAWKLDKAHSQVNFTVSHMVFSEVTGAFSDFEVRFVTSKDDFTDAVIEATIKTASIDTQNERRDNHVRGDDFLNAEKFPEMKFKSTKIEKTGHVYKIHGMLTIRDITKPVVLDTQFRGAIKDAWGNNRIAFKAVTKVDRFEFGTTWNKALETGGLVAGKEVEVTLLMQFTEPKQG